MRKLLCFCRRRKRVKCDKGLLKKRGGYSLLELVASLIILSLFMSVIINLMLTKVGQTVVLDSQYSVLAADAFVADIFHDFHNCDDLSYEISPLGQRMLTFTSYEGTDTLYSFDMANQTCYKNGVRQFDCERMNIVYAQNMLVLDLRISEDENLHMVTYR